MNKIIKGQVDLGPKGEVSAVFSTFDVVDHDGDVVRPGAIKAGPCAISAWNHGSWNAGMPPVGVGHIRTTATEAILDGRFLLDQAAGRDTFLIVQAMHELGLGEWSYSLHDVIGRPVKLPSGTVQEISSMTVREVSPVMAAASMNTRTLSAKELAELARIRDSITSTAQSDVLTEFLRFQRSMVR